MKSKIIILIVLAVSAVTAIAVFNRKGAIVPQERVFSIEARRYAYNPAIIRVNRGDKIVLKLRSKDVTHGFFLEGYDIDAKIRAQYPYFWVRHPSKHDDYEQAEEISFIADKPGKFRYRCSVTCGSFHPFMQGEFIVEPNFAYAASIGMVLGLAMVVLIILRFKKD